MILTIKHNTHPPTPQVVETGTSFFTLSHHGKGSTSLGMRSNTGSPAALRSNTGSPAALRDAIQKFNFCFFWRKYVSC